MANVIENVITHETGTSFEFEAVTGTQSFPASIFGNGAYCFRVNPTTTNTGSGRVASISGAGVYTGAAATTLFIGFPYQYATKPASGSEEIFRFVSGTTTLKCAARINASGNLELYDIAGTKKATSTTVLAASTTYFIFARAANSASGLFELLIYDATMTLLETVSDASCNMGAINVGRVIIGKMVNQFNQSVDFYYGDIWVDSSAYPPTSFWQSNLQKIVSDNTNGFTAGTGASDYTQISGVPLSTSTYVQDPAAAAPVTYRGNMDTFVNSNINANTLILAVKVFVLALDVTATTDTFQAGLRSNATNSISTATNLPTSNTEINRILTTDPNTGAAWTKAGVEAALVTFMQGTNSEDTRVFFAGIIVIHVPPTVKTITGLSRIQKIVPQTITGLSRITKSVSQTILGRARIQKSVSQTIPGQSRISQIVAATILGKAKILNSAMQTILGKASIIFPVTKTITGKAKLAGLGRQTITGQAHICVDEWETPNSNAWQTPNNNAWQSDNTPDWFLDC